MSEKKANSTVPTACLAPSTLACSFRAQKAADTSHFEKKKSDHRAGKGKAAVIGRNCDKLSKEAVCLSWKYGFSCAKNHSAEDMHEEIVRQLRLLIFSPPDNWLWQPCVRTSVALCGGDGVHIRGYVPSGKLVAFYPGVSYLLEDLSVMHHLILKGNDYILARPDGVIIDGRESGVSKTIRGLVLKRDFHSSSGTNACSGRDKMGPEMLAVGHKVNHPPAGVEPNVRVVPLDLFLADGIDLLKQLQNVSNFSNFTDADTMSPRKQTAVLVTLRQVQDEELWLDYNLQKTAKQPSWYTPVESRDPCDTLMCQGTAIIGLTE